MSHKRHPKTDPMDSDTSSISLTSSSSISTDEDTRKARRRRTAKKNKSMSKDLKLMREMMQNQDRERREAQQARESRLQGADVQEMVQSASKGMMWLSKLVEGVATYMPSIVQHATSQMDKIGIEGGFGNLISASMISGSIVGNPEPRKIMPTEGPTIEEVD